MVKSLTKMWYLRIHLVISRRLTSLVPIIQCFNEKIVLHTHSKVGLPTRENGSEIREMATAYRFGVMVPVMRGFGQTTRQMGRVNSTMLVVTYSKGSGKTINLTDTGSTYIKTVLSTREYGKMICNMVTVRSDGLMGLVMRAFTSLEKNVERVSIFGQMVVGMKVTG